MTAEPPPMRLFSLAFPLAVLSCSGCVSMPLARSAETRPGPTVEFSHSVSYSPDGISRCLLSRPLFECSELLLGGSIGMSYGWISDGRPAGRALGAGLSAADGRVLPYLDYYRQDRSGESARGLGARAAVSIDGWTELQAYARVDHWLASGQVLTWNPAIVVISGRKDSSTAGTFIGVSNAIGLLQRQRRSSVVPSLSLVIGRGQGEYPSRMSTRSFGPEWVVIGAFGMTYTMPARRRRR